MTDEQNETRDWLSDLSAEEDLWVRGRAYVTHKRLLAKAEVEILYQKRTVARAQYEYEITQRIRDKTTEPEARYDWDIQVSVAHDFMVLAEQELAEMVASADYHRALVAAMKDDLGDEAEEYAAVLAGFDWVEEWDEDDFDEFEEFAMYDAEFEEFAMYDAEFDPSAPVPFPDDKDVGEPNITFDHGE